MDTNETTQHQLAASQGRSLPKAAAFVLDCLAQLPEAFQVAVGHLLLLQPFTEASDTVHLYVMPVLCTYGSKLLQSTTKICKGTMLLLLSDTCSWIK